MSAGRYIHITDAETYQPIEKMIAELQTAEAEARRNDAALKKVLGKLGFSNSRGRAGPPTTASRRIGSEMAQMAQLERKPDTPAGLEEDHPATEQLKRVP